MKFFPMLMTLTCSAFLLNSPAFADTKQDRKVSKAVTSKAEQKSSKHNPKSANQSASRKNQAKNAPTTTADRKTPTKQKNAQAQTSPNQAKALKKSDPQRHKSKADTTSQQVQTQEKKRTKRQALPANFAEEQVQQKKDRKAKSVKAVEKPVPELDNTENNIAGEAKSPTSSKKSTRRPHKSGVASWYGGYFHGRLTANGERYNMNELTAAHRTLPFGTQVRVTNLRNNKSVNVRINDRGPYSKGRVIDLSRKANQIIDCHLCQVSIEVLGK